MMTGIDSDTSKQQQTTRYDPVYFKPATILWSPGDQEVGPDSSGHFIDQPHSTGQDLNVYDETRQHLLSIPIAFLIEGGVATDRNALDTYILEAVHCSYHEDGSLRWPSHAQDIPDASLDLVFVRDDGLLAPCQPQQGPHFGFPYGLFTLDELSAMTRTEGDPFPDEEEDEWSDVDDDDDDDDVYGEEDSANETEEDEEEDEDDSISSESKLSVQRRDWRCIFVDKGSPERCMVLPLVSPKWLNQALEPQTKMSDSASSLVAEHPSSNLLIGLDLVGSWESGGISLYPTSNGTYIVHVFRLYDPCLRPLHGKVISRERFKCDDEDLLNPALVKYRYQQSVIKFLRGRSHGPLPCTTETLHNLIEERPGLFLKSYRDRIPGLSYESS